MKSKLLTAIALFLSLTIVAFNHNPANSEVVNGDCGLLAEVVSQIAVYRDNKIPLDDLYPIHKFIEKRYPSYMSYASKVYIYKGTDKNFIKENVMASCLALSD